MTILSLILWKNFALELSLFRPIRSFKDGISFLEFKACIDLYEEDHKPSFDVSLLVLNLMVFELNIYNISHKFS